MLSAARASGFSDTRAGCPGLVTGPAQSGSCVAVTGCPARMPGSCVVSLTVARRTSDREVAGSTLAKCTAW